MAKENMAADGFSELEKKGPPIPPKFQKSSPGLAHLAPQEVSSDETTRTPLTKVEAEVRAHQAVPGELTAENINKALKALPEPYKPNIPEGAVVNMTGPAVGLGPFGPKMPPDKVRSIMNSLIVTEEARLPNLMSLSSTTLESAFEIHQRRFFDLMAIKDSQRLDRERAEIETTYQEFAARWWLRAAELAANFGNKDRFMEIVPTADFKEAFEHAWEIPGVEEGARWIEEDQGQCFRNGHNSIDEISAELQKGVFKPPVQAKLEAQAKLAARAKLAATVVQRLYVATGEITRFVGPTTGSTPREGELVEKKIRDNVFGTSTPDLTNPAYWNAWFDEWTDPKYDFLNLETRFKSQLSANPGLSDLRTMLSGNPGLLWIRTIFTPEYLAAHQDIAAFRARSLIDTFDTHIRPMSAFYKCKNLVEFRQKSKAENNFFPWARMVADASDFVDNKVVPFLKLPFGSAEGIFDQPQTKMVEVMKPFIDLSAGLTFLNRLGSREPSFGRAFILREVLRYMNTNEGQQILRLRNKALHSNRPLGAEQFQWAIYYSQAGIEEEEVQKLYRQYRGNIVLNTARRAWIGFVKALPGGKTFLWLYDRLVKPFI